MVKQWVGPLLPGGEKEDIKFPRIVCCEGCIEVKKLSFTCTYKFSLQNPVQVKIQWQVLWRCTCAESEGAAWRGISVCERHHCCIASGQGGIECQFGAEGFQIVGREGEGRGVGRQLWQELTLLFQEIIKIGLEDFAVGDGVVVIQVVVCGCVFKNVKAFNDIEMGAFFFGCVEFACIHVCYQMHVVVLLHVVRILKVGCCIRRLSFVRYIWFGSHDLSVRRTPFCSRGTRVCRLPSMRYGLGVVGSGLGGVVSWPCGR